MKNCANISKDAKIFRNYPAPQGGFFHESFSHLLLTFVFLHERMIGPGKMHDNINFPRSGDMILNMYWAYLTLFIFIVFVPTLITQGYWAFGETIMEEFAILVLGSFGFMIFLVMEKRSKRYLKEKNHYQTQVNRMSKDLTKSYSYIGEINRKLDILENIALGYPESSQLSTMNQDDAYDSIMGAVQVFGKSDEFILRFVQRPKMEILQEIKSFPEFETEISDIECEEGRFYCENDKYIMISSPKTVEDIFSCLIIKKNQINHRIEDREMMKTLISQALFIFMFLRHKKQIKCVL